jgi:hypothetical protein
MVQVVGSDSPGEIVSFDDVPTKEFLYLEDYKIDIRESGRMMNIKIKDCSACSGKPWSVSAYGFKADQAESRGR